MPEIRPNYMINSSTMAILPVRNINYDTIIYERDRTLFIRKTPLQLIKQACLQYGASYDGRRAAVMHLLGSKKKVPIPISVSSGIYAFPTQSPNQFDCTWIFYSHVSRIRVIRPLPNSNYQASIVFQTDQLLDMKESYYLLEKQMHRTATCIYHFSSAVKNGV
ncbi:competence protein ComK [Radiobacillus sp. PE A8.2]|uniref:competence protein ComK n=1 Tax=Radiobacillus sp. PE A8.2 TaxID=3380349 RepID=UPI00389012FE